MLLTPPQGAQPWPGAAHAPAQLTQHWRTARGSTRRRYKLTKARFIQAGTSIQQSKVQGHDSQPSTPQPRRNLPVLCEALSHSGDSSAPHLDLSRPSFQPCHRSAREPVGSRWGRWRGVGWVLPYVCSGSVSPCHCYQFTSYFLCCVLTSSYPKCCAHACIVRAKSEPDAALSRAAHP